MNKRILVFTVALLAVAMLATPLISAVPPVTVQQITGKLGGADYLIRIPSNWQGDLVVFCRGYSHELFDVDLFIGLICLTR